MSDPSPKNKRLPFPQLNAFRSFVIDELRRRKTAYPNPINAPFVRLTSAKQDPTNNYVFFTMGLHGYGAEDTNIFDVTYGGGKDIVGYASDLTSPDLTRARKRLIFSDELSAGDISPLIRAQLNESSPELLGKVQEDIDRQIGNQRIIYAGGAHPIPGITNVSVKRAGIGTPLIATIRWSCYNRTQLEFLRNHFMVAGGYCVIEFGQNFHDKTVANILDFQNVNATRNALVNCILEGRKYVIDNYVEPNSGNYDFLVGVIGNYEVELDAKTGIYNCTTTLVSVGEEAWGLNNAMTMVRKSAEDSNEPTKPSSFHDFFQYGGIFDQDIIANSKLSQNVANFDSNPSAWAGDAFEGYSSNKYDYEFISWNYFCNVMIPRMMELISDTGIKSDIEQFINFYINKNQEPDNPDEQTWVGNHKELRSTNPDIMLLVKSDMKNVPQGFTGAGYFDQFPGADGFRGKLTHGVWLNVGMVRACFLETQTFQQAIKSVLIRMNSAVAGYWQLQLFYEADEGRYRIVDNKYGDGRDKTLPVFYKFNTGGKGELLNVGLDSSFPPELITQMMLYARFKGETQTRQQELLKRYPAIGTTSTFALALNWTSLVDIINMDIDKKRGGAELSPLQRTELEVPAKGSGVNQSDNTRVVNRIAGLDVTNIGASSVSVRTSPNVGAPQSTTQPIVLPKPKVTTFASAFADIKAFVTGTPRNSVKPVSTSPRPLIVQRADPYKSLIERAAAKYGVDADLIRAVIAQESSFRSAASRTELLLNDSSQGLMQITLSTARGLGFNGTSAQLSTPENSIEFGTKYLASCLATRAGNIEDAVSMYNGGFRPKLAFGKVAGTTPTRVCLAWNQTQKGVCDRWYVPAPGQYGNQPHVNKVIGYYNTFRKDAGREPFIGNTTDGTLQPSSSQTGVQQARDATVNASGTSPASNSSSAEAERDKKAEDARQQIIDDKIKNITTRFGSSIINLIAPSESAMINLITRDGYLRHPTPNSFVAPFPTTTSVEVELQGISGISVSDGFVVDRLPFIFERYGVFQVTEMTDVITGQGWKTKVRGYFKLIWLNGNGPDKNLDI